MLQVNSHLRQVVGLIPASPGVYVGFFNYYFELLAAARSQIKECDLI